jgi:hypothetical protein
MNIKDTLIISSQSLSLQTDPSNNGDHSTIKQITNC